MPRVFVLCLGTLGHAYISTRRLFPLGQLQATSGALITTFINTGHAFQSRGGSRLFEANLIGKLSEAQIIFLKVLHKARIVMKKNGMLLHLSVKSPREYAADTGLSRELKT